LVAWGPTTSIFVLSCNFSVHHQVLPFPLEEVLVDLSASRVGADSCTCDASHGRGMACRWSPTTLPSAGHQVLQAMDMCTRTGATRHNRTSYSHRVQIRGYPLPFTVTPTPRRSPCQAVALGAA
jgi:hypothetical protein